MNNKPVDYEEIVFKARDILNCGDLCNVPDALARLNTRYNDALARIATLKREKADKAGEPATCEMRCQLAGELCGAMSAPVGGFYCTLPKGHAGPHIACGGDSYRHDIETWV